MCKSGIINNEYVAMVAANHQGHGGTPHSCHWQTEFLHGFNCRTTQVCTHLSTLGWCAQKPKIWSTYKNCLSQGKKSVAGGLSFKSNKIIPKLLITRI